MFVFNFLFTGFKRLFLADSGLYKLKNCKNTHEKVAIYAAKIQNMH